MKIMSCDVCARGLYRTDGENVRDCLDGERVRPIVLVIKREQYIFCSKECASKWLLEQPSESLRGGYPMF
jgi:hypothetical protein